MDQLKTETFMLEKVLGVYRMLEILDTRLKLLEERAVPDKLLQKKIKKRPPMSEATRAKMRAAWAKKRAAAKKQVRAQA